MIYSIYGQSGAGKTTIAERLRETLIEDRRVYANSHSVGHLDGDEFRTKFKNTDYSREGRRENIRHLNSVATWVHASDYQILIISFVNPYEDLREELKRISKTRVVEVYLHTERDLRKDYHIEDFEAGHPDYKLNTDEEIDISFTELKKEMFLGGLLAKP
jgi:adenylylsulfate kinase-like enzyme